MTVLNTADWLLSCNTPSSATSMRADGTLHVFGCVDLTSGLLSATASMFAPLFYIPCSEARVKSKQAVVKSCLSFINLTCLDQ